MEDKDMRKVIIRLVMGLVWIGVAVAGMVMGRDGNLLYALMGAAFIFSAFSHSKKNKGEAK